MKFVIVLIAVTFSILLIAQEKLQTPLEKSGFKELSTNEQLVAFLKELKEKTGAFELNLETKTKQGRIIPIVHFPAKMEADTSKFKILFFAQQHGDEPSGKEGMLMLIRDIAQGKYALLSDNFDLTIIPQVNADGGAINRRRNSNGMDLNRNHLILTEIETSLIHEIYQRELPHFSIDFHEYGPYSEDWTKYGARKDFDEQIGCLTNPNLPVELKYFEREKAMPFVFSYLQENGFSYHEYLVGGPPEVERLRYSTTDMNDGRQSLGFFGSMSFIVEGKNGRDSIDNIERRSKGQYTAARGFLTWLEKNYEEVRRIVAISRNKLASVREGKNIAMAFEHIRTNEVLPLHLKSVATGKDTLVSVKEFHPKVKVLTQINRPFGYLIPAADTLLITNLKKHRAKFSEYKASEDKIVYQYWIVGKDTANNEEDDWIWRKTEKKPAEYNSADYFFLPLDDINSIYLVMALEPLSMFGMVQYPKYKYLTQSDKYPILRVESKNIQK